MKLISCFLLGFLLMIAKHSSAQRLMEKLDRGVVAVRNNEGKVFVSWRLLGTEPNDLAFNLYRTIGAGKAEKLNKQPIGKTTHFIDDLSDTTSQRTYFVKTITRGKEDKESKAFVLKPGSAPYLSIPLQTPAGYSANDASVGDLDGDGAYEIVLHMAGVGKDNSQKGITDPPIIHAYRLNGQLLWSINLGKNIREGAHYTQFMVYDLDGDGKAEVAMKTGDGTIDSKGTVIGDSSKDWRNNDGYILSGPEYLTVFNGLTGAALATTDFIPPRHPSTLTPTTDQLKEIWGDGYGNRVDRFLGAVAYLDGKTPSLIMSRGYYTRSVIAAWNFRDGKIKNLWTFDSDDSTTGNKAYRGQGNHNLTVADVDGDGKDEIVFGAMTIDDNGKGLYSTGLGHGDALHVSDLDPSRPGLEVFDIQERFSDAGANFRDAKTGEVIWKKPSVKAGADGEGPGRGLALDIDPRYPGYECWVFGAGIFGLFDNKGNQITTKTPPSCNFGVFWDGDVLGELLNGTTIAKWKYESDTTHLLLDAAKYNCVRNNGTKSTPVLSADLFGDWREEVIWRTTDNNELRIFSTSIPTDRKFYTLMHDPHYRLSVAWQNVAYNQPPHTSFYIGEGMKNPPRPNISIIKKAQ